MATFKNDRRVEVMSATGETVTAAYLLGIGEGRSMLKGMKARGEVIDAATISALIDNLTRCLAQGFAREMADTFRGERAFWRNQLRLDRPAAALEFIAAKIAKRVDA